MGGVGELTCFRIEFANQSVRVTLPKAAAGWIRPALRGVRGQNRGAGTDTGQHAGAGAVRAGGGESSSGRGGFIPPSAVGANILAGLE